jgi:hypothetical protein
MTKLVLAFFILLGLTGIVRSQELPQILTMPILTACVKTTDLNKSLFSEYGETQMVAGVAIIVHNRLNEYVEGMIKIYVNTKTFSFTVVFENPKDGMSCVIATGDELKPAPQGITL